MPPVIRGDLVQACFCKGKKKKKQSEKKDFGHFCEGQHEDFINLFTSVVMIDLFQTGKEVKLQLKASVRGGVVGATTQAQGIHPGQVGLVFFFRK